MASYTVKVTTGKYKYAGTDSYVYITLTGNGGKNSQEFRLDVLWKNDFERGQEDTFVINTAEDFGDIESIQIRRDGYVFGFDDWNVERVLVTNDSTKKVYPFPCHRWIESGKPRNIMIYDSALPKDEQFREQRAAELEEKRAIYEYAVAYPGLPLQIKELPSDEEFLGAYKIDIYGLQLKLVAQRLWEKLRHDTGIFEKFEDLIEMYDRFPNLVKPEEAVKYWREDWYFGRQRLAGSNPSYLRRCDALPEKFAVDPEKVKPFLESDLESAIKAKRIYIEDFACHVGISTKNDAILCKPFGLFYAKDDDLMPIAIQLYQEPASDNPVFYPSDDKNVWTCAKMWFNNADANYHQAITHLAETHFVMSGICVAMNRQLSVSHPIFQLLEPHFLYLLAINTAGLASLVTEGGSSDRTLAVGYLGILELAVNRHKDYNVSYEADFPGKLEAKGVADTEALKNYPYRDDGMAIWTCIRDYVDKMIKFIYPQEQMIAEDPELEKWAQEMRDPSDNLQGLNLKGLPGDGHFTKHDHLTKLITWIIFTGSCEHAAANFNQYDDYGFPPSYPGKLYGVPPKSKDVTITDADLCALIGRKIDMLTIMVNTRILSTRGTHKLGTFEVQYHYHPTAVKIADEFRASLVEAGKAIDERNAKRRIPYDVLHSDEVPNAISI